MTAAKTPDMGHADEAPDGPELFTPRFFHAIISNDLIAEGRALMLAADILKDRTGWSDGQLKRQLGCDPESIVDQDPDEAKRRLAFSQEYLTWLRELAKALGDPPVPRFHRDLLRLARQLHAGASGEHAHERLVRCRRAMERRDGLQWPPAEYLALGEIQRAFEVAAGALIDTGWARTRTGIFRNSVRDSALASIRPHVHPERAVLALTEDAALALGVPVRDTIREHLQGGCTACLDAAGLRPSDVELDQVHAAQQTAEDVRPGWAAAA